MHWPDASLWLNPFLDALQTAQLALQRAAHALHWSGDSHGQPAWPWARRISTETLQIDLGATRQLVLALLATAGAMLLALAGIAWRRGRVLLLIIAALTAWFAPWPDSTIWLADAVPTSFQQTSFDVASIARGAQVYAQHCAACHGADGRGSGPLAATLVRWPPTVVGPLLGHRLDGEMFWRVLHGTRDFHGARTMPGFARAISDADAWATIDYMKVLAAGGGAQSGQGWPIPVALPALDVRCADGTDQPVERWRAGQRVRVVALGSPPAPPLEDPRWQTLLIAPDDARPTHADAARWAASGRASCVASTRGAWHAFAGIAGLDPDRFALAQLLADRDGWLRAEARPGDAGWANATLLCSANGSGATVARSGDTDPLTALLKEIDAEPVRYVKGGYVH
ncbi:MAG TPA: cytochrome c [Paraburkholderia sp.]|jgi:mono/diheme cytochrome c family protein|nr:cytochrome c [Paraburkholderia sp.]